MRTLIVIPARLHSTRLPRKLLLRETGRSLIEHTYRAARQARRPSDVIVATDAEEIRREVERFGGRAEMTSPACQSGTDRVAEVARHRSDVDVFVNVQGDEPEISAAAVDQVIELLQENPRANMATLCAPIRTAVQLEDPACVKAVFNARGEALYFSRGPIPFPRGDAGPLLKRDPPAFHQHIGLYAYRREFLLQLAMTPPSHLELTEGLEQLRVLSAGHTIQMGVIDEPTIGIDTPQDYAAFVRRWSQRG